MRRLTVSTRLVIGAVVLLGAIAGAADSADTLPDGWTARSVRDSMRPRFGMSRDRLTGGEAAIVIESGASPGQHGWVEKTVPVERGRYYQFSSQRHVSNVAEPRKSAPVRIKWTNDAGKSVPADIPPGHEDDPGYAPLAEPEHPQDGSADADGWVTVFGLYRAPSQATRATLELHLQWAPRGSVAWRNVEFIESPPPPPREVKLAAVHYQPTGKSPRQNCEEFAPFIVEAARQQADLVVLGETIPYVRVNKPPHETAEPVPGPTTVYFGTLAKQHRLHIVLSLYEMESDIVYNTAVLVGPEGSLIGKYRKVCLPHSEIEAGVTPGTEYPVFDTALGKVGMMVCYDGFYPEVARELSNRGAEIIAWPVWGCNPLLARARACENHVFLVSSTFSQGKDWMTTAVFDRAGRPLVEADQNGEVIVTTVDLSRPHFWKNNLGDFRSMIPRHRP